MTVPGADVFDILIPTLGLSKQILLEIPVWHELNLAPACIWPSREKVDDDDPPCIRVPNPRPCFAGREQVSDILPPILFARMPRKLLSHEGEHVPVKNQ